MFKIYFYTKISPILLTSDDEKLLSVDFVSEFKEIENPCALLKEAKRQFELYFAGKLFEFNLPIKAQGKGFEAKVYKALHEIAYGSTLSYKEMAEKIGHKKAFRAVGNANSKNNLPIIVPCHRVIASSGALGGYTSKGAINTLAIKRFLLGLEARNQAKFTRNQSKFKG